MSIWRGLEKAFDQTSQMLSQYLMSEYQRGRDEERDMRMFKEKSDYQEEAAIRNREDTQLFSENMQASSQKFTAEHDKWQADYGARLSNYGNNPDLKQFLEEGIQINDPDIKNQATQAMGVWNSLREGNPMGEEQQAVVSQLPMNVQGTFNTFNFELQQKLDSKAMQEEQHQSLMDSRDMSNQYMEALMEKVQAGETMTPIELMQGKAQMGQALASMMMNPNFTEMNMMRAQSKDGKLPGDMQVQWDIFMSAAGALDEGIKMYDAELAKQGIQAKSQDKGGGPLPPPTIPSMVTPDVKKKHKIAEVKEVYDSMTYQMALKDGTGKAGDLIYDEAQDRILVNLGEGKLVDLDEMAKSQMLKNMLPQGKFEELIKSIRSLPDLGPKILGALTSVGDWIQKQF